MKKNKSFGIPGEMAVSSKYEPVSSEAEYNLPVTFEKAIEILAKSYIKNNLTSELTPLKDFINKIERSVIDSTLLLTMGNQKNASEILGVKKTSLNQKIKRFKIVKNKNSLNLDTLKIDTGI